jgi:Ca2+-binding EF-hand superfamily protein
LSEWKTYYLGRDNSAKDEMLQKVFETADANNDNALLYEEFKTALNEALKLANETPKTL